MRGIRDLAADIGLQTPLRESDLAEGATDTVSDDDLLFSDGSSPGSGGSLGNSSDNDGSALSLPESFLADSDGGGLGAGDVAVRAAPLSLETNRLLEAEVASLRHSRQLLEAELNEERARSSAALREAEERYAAELRELRDRAAAADEELPRLRQRLAASKDSLRHLAISDALFAELREMPEEQLSVGEFVRAQAHALTVETREQLDQVRRELELVRGELATTTEHGEGTVAEMRAQVRGATLREAAKADEVSLLEQSNKALQRRLGEVSAQLADFQNKHSSIAAVIERKDWLEREYEYARELADRQTAATQRMTEERDAAQARAADLEQQWAVFQRDKEFLTRELRQAEGARERSEREAERLTQRVADLERAKEAFYSQLLEAREEHRTAYEHRLTEELGRMQAASRKELEDIRVSSRDVFERENRVLRESRAEAVAETERVRAKLEELSRAYDDLVLRTSKDTSAFESQLSELRNELKMKEFELFRVGSSYEERMGALGELRVENDSLRKQLEVHVTEFTQLEAAARGKQTELEAQVTVQAEQLRHYEELEVELDGAILQAGALGADDDDAAAVDLSAVPTAAKRRMRQSLLLSQRLLAAQTRIKQLDGEAGQLRAQLERRDAELANAGRKLEHTRQPAQYLIDTIGAREGEARAARAELEQAREESRELRVDLEAERRARRTAEAELAALLEQREELDAIKMEIQQLAASGPAAVMGGSPPPPLLGSAMGSTGRGSLPSPSRRGRSPHRSPSPRRSPSPAMRRSPSPALRRSPSPRRSPSRSLSPARRDASMLLFKPADEVASPHDVGPEMEELLASRDTAASRRSHKWHRRSRG